MTTLLQLKIKSSSLLQNNDSDQSLVKTQPRKSSLVTSYLAKDKDMDELVYWSQMYIQSRINIFSKKTNLKSETQDYPKNKW